MMQSDDDVGRVRAEAPIVMCTLVGHDKILSSPSAHVLESFIEQLVQQATDLALADKAKTLQPGHVYVCA